MLSTKRTPLALFLYAVVTLVLAGLTVVGGALAAGRGAKAEAHNKQASSPAGAAVAPTVDVRYRTVKVGEVDILYREAGPKNAPTILLLHGFPTSSHMFRNLIPALSDKYHVIAPDYPGYGNSSIPSISDFDYSFDHLAVEIVSFTQTVGISKFAMYVMDYGAPIGYRIASAHPERITGLIVQNGNAYDEGLLDFWKPFKAYWKEQSAENRDAMAKLLNIDATKWQYTNGVRDVSTVSRDNWIIDQAGMDRPGNKDIQLRFFLSYGTNPPLYVRWQEYFRTYQPPTLIVWGKNDAIFLPEGAEPYKRDLKNLDFNLLDTGHFALEEKGDVIAVKIRAFMRDRVAEQGALGE